MYVSPDASQALLTFRNRVELRQIRSQESEEVPIDEEWGIPANRCGLFDAEFTFSSRGDSALLYYAPQLMRPFDCYDYWSNDPEHPPPPADQGVIFTLNPLRPHMLIQDLDGSRPQYDPSGETLVYVGGDDECGALRLVDVAQASVRTLAPDVCFKRSQNPQWIR